MALLAEYPKNVSSTAFASFLEIERLQYKKGLEKAGGATESLLTSNLAGFLGGIGTTVGGIYNTGADQSTISQLESTLAQAQGIEATSIACLLYTSPSPRDRTRSRMPSSA